MGTLPGVSQILMCIMLVALLAGGPAAVLPPNAPATVLPSGAAAVVPEVPDHPGDEPPPPAGSFGWPLPGFPAVARAFEAPAHRFGPGHRGVDLAAETGTPVLAAGAGTVVFAGPVAGRGVVSIDHVGGLRTTYEPVSPIVRAGDLVARGEQIGTVQARHPGCAACPHSGVLHEGVLHWGVRRGMDYLDPLRLLALGRLRLLPWDASPGSR